MDQHVPTAIPSHHGIAKQDLEIDTRLKFLVSFQIHFVLLISRQGKVRLTKWYSPYTQKERTKVIRELSGLILNRGPKLCNFVEWRGYKVVYKRYASLYFCMCIDQDDNELEILEIIHHFVEILDRYFGSVCELDLIFNFHKLSFKGFQKANVGDMEVKPLAHWSLYASLQGFSGGGSQGASKFLK
ncbi:UNVERIFIED_CONTAM: AP-1 complex subunit sigma-2 [Sesamum radiatum]|uniref:Adaptor AP-1 19 kDa protein n=1 Tax=Sesamum radiatum TaxID=300843 RepID=A0AAW2QFG5_SESRA